MLRGVPLANLLALVWAFGPGCRIIDGGVGDGNGGSGGAFPGGDGTTDQTADSPAFEARPPGDVRGELPLVEGPPGEIGCADGTREGFLDPTAWTRIAACSGAWLMPGLLGEAARSPHCERGAGNTGRITKGGGCGVADLCAAGWHVCTGPAEVAQNSPTDCESAYPSGFPMFFLVRSGASPSGVCSPDTSAANDLHGCGNIGQPESQACQPLERRMGFTDCLATGGIWACGDVGSHLNEAAIVTKRWGTGGGVLCCRD